MKECPYCDYADHLALFIAPLKYIPQGEKNPEKKPRKRTTDRYLVCPDHKCGKIIGIISQEEANAAYEDFTSRTRENLG